MSASNRMDPSRIDYTLNKPTIVEEMLIARVYIQVECFQIRGQQQSYCRHVVSFLKDMIQVYNKLPLIPTDLNIVVLKLAEADNTNTADRYARQLQFTREFTIRKDVVLTQLRFLKANYPGYRDVSIDYKIDLPDNANIIEQVANGQYRGSASRETTSNQRLRTQLEGNPANSAEEDTTNNEGFDSSAIPAINADSNLDRNLDDLRRRVGTASLGSR